MCHSLAELHRLPLRKVYVWKTWHLVSVAVLALPYAISQALAFKSSVADVSTATTSNLYPSARASTTDWPQHYLHVLLFCVERRSKLFLSCKTTHCVSCKCVAGWVFRVLVEVFQTKLQLSVGRILEDNRSTLIRIYQSKSLGWLSARTGSSSLTAMAG